MIYNISYDIETSCQSSPQNSYNGSHFIQNESQSPYHGL